MHARARIVTKNGIFYSLFTKYHKIYPLVNGFTVIYTAKNTVNRGKVLLEVKIMKILRELRKAKSLTIAKTAESLNMPFETYRSYEAGRNQADYETLVKLADFFGVSVDYLLGRDEFKPEERAAGFSETRKMTVTPIEDDLLYVFRQIGKRFGEQAQRDYITVGENMLKLK